MTSTLLRNWLELMRVYQGGKPGAEAPHAAAAVVLGAEVCPEGRPSRTLRARALFAARLYSEGIVRVVIPTGGVGENPPSEAAVISKILRDAGVPEENIFREEWGRNTWDSARLVAKLASEQSVEDVLVVTDPLHCVRAVSVFREAGLPAVAAPVYDSPMWRRSPLRRRQFFREMAAITWYWIKPFLQR